jgi:HEAT repeats
MARRISRPHSVQRLALLCLALALGALPARPGVMPGPDVTALAEQADLIVVGRVAREDKLQETTLPPNEGNFPAWVTVVRLHAEGVLKGVPGGRSVSFRALLPVWGVGAEAPRYKPVNVGQFGIFFLAGTSAGYEVLDPYCPYLPAAPGAPPQQGNPVDAVAGELAYVFESHDPSVQSRWARWEAVKALETVKRPSATAALREAAHDSDALVRVWAISALLRRDDISMLDEVEKLVPIPPDPSVQNLTAELGFAVGTIKDGKAVPSLIRLLWSKDVNIRRGAAEALRNMHDPKAVKPLSRALFDSDQQVRYYAVVGLGETTGQNEWTPSIANFDKNEKKFLDHWREWAKENKVAP